MVKNLILICLVGSLGIIGFVGPAWANTTPSTPVWIAQMEISSPTVPPAQARLNNPSTHPSTNPPTHQPETPTTSDQTTSDPTTSNQATADQAPDRRSSSVQARSDSTPFNPYDMKALKQFDAGDHRTE